MIDPMPGRRRSIRGLDANGNSVTLEFTVSKQLYRCPWCRASIEVGSEHVLAIIETPGQDPYHQHWHRDCARSELLRTIRNPQAIAPTPGLTPGARRAATRERRRRGR